MGRVITTNMAYAFRHERALLLPPNGEYEDSRVAEIARRQSELMQEFNELDQALDTIYKEKQNDRTIS